MAFKKFYESRLTEESNIKKAIQYINAKAKKHFVHISPNENVVPTKQREVRDKGIGKPAGIWGALGTGWLEWVQSEMPDWYQENIYTFQPVDIVDYDKNIHDYGLDKILRIKPKDVEEFTKQYSTMLTQTLRGESENTKNMYYDRAVKNRPLSIKVDWDVVSKKCGGVLFAPYDRGEGFFMHLSWYGGVDIPSVCVFDPKCIKNWTDVSDEVRNYIHPEDPEPDEYDEEEMTEAPIGQVAHKMNIKIVIDKSVHAGERQGRHIHGDEKGGSNITGQEIDDKMIRSVAHKGTRRMIDNMIMDKIDIGDPVHIKDKKSDLNVIGVMEDQNGELVFKVITVMVKPNFHAKRGTTTVEV